MYDQKFRGVLPEKLGGGVQHISWNLTLFQTKICDFPYPISDLIKNLISYFRPEALEPSAWPEHVTSCYGTYTLVSVNIIREMVLSWKTYPIQTKMVEIDILFQTKTTKKNIPFGTAHTLYLYSLYIGTPPPPPRAKNALQIMSLTAYASETN